MARQFGAWRGTEQASVESGGTKKKKERRETEREREGERGKKVQFGEHTSRLGEESLAWPIEDGLKNLKQRQNRRCVEIKSVKSNELVNWIGSPSSLNLGRGVENRLFSFS